MSDLQNLTPANTYKGLLQVGDYTNGVDSTVKAVLDGEGTASALAIGTTKVGIGTTSPTQELDVNGDIVSTTLTTSGAVTAGSVSTSGAVTAGSVSTSGAVTGGSLDVSGNVVADEYALDQTGTSSSAVAIHAPATNELAIRTNSTEAMRIDSDGNVGIGTANPDYLLDLEATTDPATIGLKGYGSFVDGSVASEILFIGKDNLNLPRGLAYIKVKEHDGNLGTGSIEFQTRILGDEETRMIISDTGHVGIGTVSPSAPLEVASTTGGVVFPRLTTAQRDAISSPTDGETIFNTTNNQLESYNGSDWVVVGSSDGIRAKTSFQGVSTVTRNTNAESNISSVTRTGTGQYTITFSTAVSDPIVSFSCGRTTNGAMFRYSYLLKNSGGTTVYSGAVSSMDISIADAGDPRDGELVQILVF